MRVGILGGGQLARMLAMAAHRIGIEPWIVDPHANAPAGRVAHHILAELDDPEMPGLLSSCDVVTAEMDHAPVGILDAVEHRVPVHPSPAAFAIAGDRFREKRFFADLGAPVAPFHLIEDERSLSRARSAVTCGARLKSRFEGYDGKGQLVVRTPEGLDAAWAELNRVPCVLEEEIDFDRELSLLAVRGGDGEIRFWDPIENHHRNGILRVSATSPADRDTPAGIAARELVSAVLERLGYVGVLAVEFFDVGGHWIVNEMACRVHNSGHATEEGAETSQFENHLRAIVGWPLGGTRSVRPTAMVNLIGSIPDPETVLKIPGARLHLYGKTPAPDRKLGHLIVPESEHAVWLGSGAVDAVRLGSEVSR